MDEKLSHVEQGQAERARRLRERIDQLKSGTSITDPGQPKSIKQQIGERVSELEKEKEGE